MVVSFLKLIYCWYFWYKMIKTLKLTSICLIFELIENVFADTDMTNSYFIIITVIKYCSIFFT